MIKLSDAKVTYTTEAGSHPALANIALDIQRGDSCVLIGPTGCGKTTLLYLLAGLQRPTGGSVQINGAPVAGPRRGTSVILQQQGLFPWKNAFDNTTLGLDIRGVSNPDRSSKARDLMEKLGIWDVKDSYPAQLSGGQRQRVAIARSLATDPDLLLMDEPFSALDAMTRETLQNLILSLWKDRRFTFLLVTHSIEEAVFLGRRVHVLSPRPGRILRSFENPGIGEISYRMTGEYHRRCLEIRDTLQRTV
jgi:NitT/TauT family transport system ATP-binding protein